MQVQAAEPSELRRAQDLTIGLLEFVTDRAISSADRERVSASIAADYRAEPGKFGDANRALSRVLKQIESVRGKPDQATIRRQVATELHWATLGTRQDDAIANVIETYVPTVVADRESRIVISLREIRALCRSTELIATALGQTLGDCEGPRAAWVKENFAQLAPDQRERLASAEHRWAVLDEMWATLSETDRHRAVDQAIKAGEGDIDAAARGLETMALLWRLRTKLQRATDAFAAGIESEIVQDAIRNAVRDF